MAEPLIPNFPSLPELITMSSEERLERLRQGHHHALARAAVEGRFGATNLEACGQAVHNFETSVIDTDVLRRAGVAKTIQELMHVNVPGLELQVPDFALYGIHWYAPEDVSEIHPLVVASWPEPDSGHHTELLLPITGDIQEFTDQDLRVLASLADGKGYAVARTTY